MHQPSRGSAGSAALAHVGAATEPLGIALAACPRTPGDGLPTKELLRLVHDRKIRFVMVKGIAHIPSDAIEEYRAKAS